MDNSDKDSLDLVLIQSWFSLDLVLSRALETQVAKSEEGAFLVSLASSLV